MNKYAQVALKATSLLDTLSPKNAWEVASLEVFPHSKTSRDKGCPKSTFLGLCEEGLIKGSVIGNYTRSQLNKQYALKALSLLQHNGNLATDTNTLWHLVVQEKKSNSQMEVVSTLWNSDLIIKANIA